MFDRLIIRPDQLKSVEASKLSKDEMRLTD